MACSAATRSAISSSRDSLVVRSSAVAEDTAGASFAGQHDTYYYIDRNRVSQAVRQCWLSLWSAHARSYRAGIGPASTERFAMAVIVQRMRVIAAPVDKAPETL